ncbi:hypothetical protein [uncultured Dokdonia sp.]|uniref:hypothetical protein n=1 Tax=uncultured Dokdonia sp. TaxID=575653 RepID=UPI0026167F40|nr:hypothetical protein [uncultured Dokdonia sp.]
MEEIHYILKNYLLLGTQFLAVLIGAIYFFKLKNSYWKWFSIYLIIIFIQEYFGINNTSIDRKYKIAYYMFFGVPLEFIFLYWLYALKSLRNKKLFFLSILVYIATIGLSLIYKKISEVYSLSMNIGTIMLLCLLTLEFIKQIKTDDILKFKENKMFYLNLGLVIFYIGNYPYHVFGEALHTNHLKLWEIYHLYFLMSNCIMYLLFAASFIWGKTQS